MKQDTFNDRQANSLKAKQALLERFKARPGPDDPAVQARMAEQKAIAEARDKRAAERKNDGETEQKEFRFSCDIFSKKP